MNLCEFKYNPVEAYLKCERFVNDGSPSKNNNTTSANTAPKSSVENFCMSLVEFEGNVEIEQIGDEVCGIFPNTIFVHPDMLNDGVLSNFSHKVIEQLIVEPTSSGRTVLSKDDKFPMFIKLAYPKCLGRLTRHMGKEKILSACEVTDRLVEAIDAKYMNPKFALLKENKGRIAKLPTEEVYEWGMIVREFKPYPYTEAVEYMMPFFSLFSSEYLPGEETINETHTPFLKQFFDAQSKESNEFLLEDILFPLFDCYFDALIHSGIELEAHGQNMLFTFDEEFKIQRIICRDLESAGRDVTLMERLGIPFNVENKYKCNQLLDKEDNQKYAKWYITHSFMFDFKLGEYIVTPMIECAKKNLPGIDEGHIIRSIKNHNKQYVEQLPDFFPPDWCYYSNENFEQTGKAKTYIWEDNPKYR